MSKPEALQGSRWTEITGNHILPILVWCAEQGKTITYGQLDSEIVRRGLGHHVMAVKYGYPAGAVGSALIEIEDRLGESIPPLNALVVNGKTNLPGKGVNYHLDHYSHPKKRVAKMNDREKQAVVEEIQADIFAYAYWGDVLDECGLKRIKGKVELDPEADEISTPKRGGWSSEPESEQHIALKEYVSKNPQSIGLPAKNSKGKVEYLFASADCADVVFQTTNSFVAAEVKSIISNKADLNRGLFQAVKYQALLRAEQKSRLEAPSAYGVLVVESNLPDDLQNLADVLGIKVYVVQISH